MERFCGSPCCVAVTEHFTFPFLFYLFFFFLEGQIDKMTNEQKPNSGAQSAHREPSLNPPALCSARGEEEASGFLH